MIETVARSCELVGLGVGIMQQIRILLVEDDPGHRELLKRILCDNRPHVHLTTASCKAEFQAEIINHTFDCVILDFHLSDSHADELIDLQNKLGRKSPAIVISGSDEQDIVVQSMRSGGVDFIHKDNAIEGTNLWDRINIVLNTHRQRTRERRQAIRREKRLLQLANRDHMTGLANRRALEQLIQGNGRGIFDRRGETSLVMIDIDHFKKINDQYGHECGDRTICAVADAIRKHISKSDAAIRYGGEEFLVILPGKTLESAVRWAENLRSDIARLALHHDNATVRLTASLGVVTDRSDHLGCETINRCDEALYLSKRRGRNQVCTAPMIDFDRIAANITVSDPIERLDFALSQMRPLLGPTQNNHLTHHSLEVSRTAYGVGKRLGMHAEQLDRLRYSGLCHDIGKMYIPEKILAKPAQLNDDEMYLIGRHSRDGADITQVLCNDDITADFVRHHHVRFDESNGDSQNAPPLGARILCVADALVTMTSDRPYQPARPFEAAIRELQQQRGRQFDPTVVDAVVEQPACVCS